MDTVANAMEMNDIGRRNTYHRLGNECGDDTATLTSDHAAPQANPARRDPDPLKRKGLFVKFAARWVLTIVLIALIIAVIKIYQQKGNITPAEKGTFDTINVALTIGLSLNFFVSRTLLLSIR